MIVEKARPQDLQEIESLLKSCDLPVEGVAEHLRHFHVVRENGLIIGCVGLELEGPLLRSLAVDPSYRGQNIASVLCERLMNEARESGAAELYLLTTTASGFFARIGFAPMQREAVPASIRNNRQFTDLCPSTAVLMRREL